MANFSLTAEDMGGGMIGYWQFLFGSISPENFYQSVSLERFSYVGGAGEVIMNGTIPGAVTSFKINGVAQSITYSLVEAEYAEYNLANPGGTNPFVGGNVYSIEMLFDGEQAPEGEGPNLATSGVLDLYGQLDSNFNASSDIFDSPLLSVEFFKPSTAIVPYLYLGAGSFANRYKGVRLLNQLYRGIRQTS
jgi:hypothetical protein